ncbi:MAG: FAD-binding oxidoreductase, partial [Alphaproteobacteria bacterium]|nr:FAD-binding oxidoreductase [Alphaproteobacteria bacterium]
TGPAPGRAARDARPGPPPLDPHDPARRLAPLRARADRIFDVAVCLRPFRAAGPCLDAEEIGDTLVVHNYGHGGSGWSLSWGSSALAVRKAMVRAPRKVAVIGCGALGLTSAILAQEAGAEVTIYARDLLPGTPSARATGMWTPDSRIALADAVDPGFPESWERMARTSFKAFRNYLGLPGEPVQWHDRYFLSDAPPPYPAPPAPAPEQPRLDFAHYHARIRDLTPRVETLPARDTPFTTDRVRRQPHMLFNLASYGHMLLADFRLAGGRIERRQFHAPAELAQLTEKAVIDCTGYGARALWRDETVVPIRGQIARLIPEPAVDYGLYYKGVSMVPRRDGIVVQAFEGGESGGYGDASETPDRAEAEHAVGVLAALYAGWGRRG